MDTQSAEDELSAIIAGAAKQPLLDAAYALWRRRYRLETIAGRPTAEEVRVNRAFSPEQFIIQYRHERAHAHEGPMFGYVKRAHPRADDQAIRQAIITAVKFEDAYNKHFDWNGDFDDCVARAVKQAARKYPHYLETTYRDARGELAYYMK
ncbi:hypothetical protein P0R31_24195 [Bradyrhizobium yuanmingense]|uniref:hypothetical protein n=1 Tax=Bradyrhizobium yuanmingense TaxID=108015 RepID=UPI0023B9DBFC|nr:hypothetical protein [Bradyrhizobium yuanmingense]MDF0520348.1 hypothetical protein [Bradyrhizobium yuanmingense]